MQTFIGASSAPVATTSAVQMKMRSNDRPAEIWTAAKVENTINDARKALEVARKDSLELRTIGPNADAIINVTSDGGTVTPEARIAKALANLDSLEKKAQAGVTKDSSGKYNISQDAKDAARQFQELSRSTTKLVEETLRDKAAVFAQKDSELQARSARESANERAKAVEELRVSLNKTIDSDPAFGKLRSSFNTDRDKGPVTVIRKGLARIGDIEARSKISGVTEAELKEARGIFDNLSILELPKYKEVTKKSFEAELANRDLRHSVQATFDKAYEIAESKFGAVTPSVSKKSGSDKDQVEFELGNLVHVLDVIDQASSKGSKVKFANSYTDEMVKGPLERIRKISEIDDASTNDGSAFSDSQV